MEDNEKQPKEEDKEYIIQHLVISGGGTYGLAAYGALRELEKKGKWNIDNIKTCHAVSIGSCVIFMILLGYDWDTLDNFLIDRPWKNVFQFDWSQLLDIFDNCGIFCIDHFKNAWEPLFSGVDLSIEITLKDFYEKTKKDFYIYAVEINNFKMECFSHKTHPEMKLIEACYASCCLPVIFKPLVFDKISYIDGGIFLNYPIYQCLHESGANKEEILGIYKTNDNYDKEVMKQETNLIEYAVLIIRRMMNLVKEYNNLERKISIPNEVAIEMDNTDFEALKYILENSENRKNIIQKGINSALHLLN